MTRRISRRTLIGGAAVAPFLIPASAGAMPEPGSFAKSLSDLERQKHIPALYTLYGKMHPDAREIVPRYAMIGWYQNDFQPREPEEAQITGAESIGDWTWDVTGKTYSSVWEVSYSQKFGDGTVENDVVRLAPLSSDWSWFFGRSKEFVDEQIARFDQRLTVPQSGDAPMGLNKITDVDASLLRRAPATISNRQDTLSSSPPDRQRIPEWLSSTDGVVYKTDIYPVAYVSVGAYQAGTTAAAALDNSVGAGLNAPPYMLNGWNTNPSSGLPWTQETHTASEAVGKATTLSLFGTTHMLQVSATDEDLLAQLVEAIVAT